MPLLVMFAIVQVVFTGVLFQLYAKPGVEQFAWLMPSRWAVAGAGRHRRTGPADAAGPDDPTNTDPLWDHTLASWTIDVGMLVLMGVLCGFVVTRLLRRHEPEVMRK